MSSPFSIFRKHQRVLTVVLTGLAMISFVLLGAINDPQNIPTTLVVIFLAAMVGGIAWMAGLTRGKASEWGVTGVFVGALVGVAIFFSSGEASAVYIDSGDLSTTDISNLQRQRAIANQFVQQAYVATHPGNEYRQAALDQLMFGFSSNAESTPVEDIILGELLRREANEQGLDVTEPMVTEFIKEMTQQRMTQKLFNEIRSQMNVSEQELMKALQSELKAKMAVRLVLGQNYPTPEAFWNFYQQLNVRQSADLVSIPVDSFIDESTEPTEQQLQELFLEYRDSVPGVGPTGELEEGRPGFVQPRRIQVGYFEATFDDIETLVEPPTEEEIQTLYEERYLRQVPESMDGPALPQFDLNFPAPDSTPAADESAAPDTQPQSDAAPEAPANTPDSESADSTASEDDTPAEAPANESSDSTSAEESGDESEAEAPIEDQPADDSGMALRRRDVNLQQVALFQEEPESEEAAETETPEEPATETPEAEPAAPEAGGLQAPEVPAEESAATDEGETGDAPSDGDAEQPAAPAMPDSDADLPPPPSSDIPELDDTLKMQLRDEIIRERTLDEIQKRSEAAFQKLIDLGARVLMEESDPEYLTAEQAREEAEQYAEENGLSYVVTPMLSFSEMLDSEDYPIARARVDLKSQLRMPMSVVEFVFQSSPAATVSVVGEADNLATLSSFAFWKLDDKDQYVPESLEDARVREQVVETWKELQARPKARERADAIAEKLRSAPETPAAEVLGETTVTGSEDSLFLTVRSVENVSWMEMPSVPPLNFMQTPQVRASRIPGVEDAGPTFYEAFFKNAEPGDVVIAPNANESAYYVARITSRNPSNEEELNQMRQRFLSGGLQLPVMALAQQTLGQYRVDWGQRLFEKHGVIISEAEIREQ